VVVGAHKTRLDIVKDGKNMIQTLNGVNSGLRYSNNAGGDSDLAARGGMVTYPITELTTAPAPPCPRRSIPDAGWLYAAVGTLLRSSPVPERRQCGFRRELAAIPGTGGEFKSVAGSRTNNINSKVYQSPMQFSCQKTFVVYSRTASDPGRGSQRQDRSAADFATDGYVSVADGGKVTSVRQQVRTAIQQRPVMDAAWSTCRLHATMTCAQACGQAECHDLFRASQRHCRKCDYRKTSRVPRWQGYTQSDAAGLTAALEEIADVAQNANSTFVAHGRGQRLQPYPQPEHVVRLVFAPTNRAHWPGNEATSSLTA
jgi:hypothetical protein